MENANSYPKLPEYRCHKIIGALKIKSIITADEINRNGRTVPFISGAEITPEEQGYPKFVVSQEYLDKHFPKVGGYYVLYKDGYESWSPADALISGYTKMNENAE